MPNFVSYVRASFEKQGFLLDSDQIRVIEALDRLSESLLARFPVQVSGWARICRWFDRPASIATQGCYIWGSVGRGKTYLMDLFCSYLSEKRQQIRFDRYHFHRFMKNVHLKLHARSGEPDPLIRIMSEWKTQVDVLCFDEFFVSDVADAMILGRLLEASLASGVCWVLTSNARPDRLYPNGLQRHLFLKTIALIQSKLEVIQLQGAQDYREKHLPTQNYFHVLSGREGVSGESDAVLARHYFHFTHKNPPAKTQAIPVQHRLIEVRAQEQGVLWCDFDKLCGTAKSYGDYLEISQDYFLVLLGPVPVFNADMEDQARRFVCLVDEFYDQHVKLVLTMASAVDELYQGELLRFEFNRTISRLKEMQTEYFWNKPHGR